MAVHQFSVYLGNDFHSAFVDTFGSDGLHAVCTLYLWTGMSWGEEKLVAIIVGPLHLYCAALSRHTIYRTAVDLLWVVIIGTAAWISVSGLILMAARCAFESPAGAFRLSPNAVLRARLRGANRNVGLRPL